MEKLKLGKDYVNVHDNTVIVIDRVECIMNRGFEGEEYKKYFNCLNYKNWREATEQEVIKAFRKHLIHRYGEDWKTMKIKDRHPSLVFGYPRHDGLWNVVISKGYGGWSVWNENGLLYYDGIWVERLEDIEVINKKASEKLLIDKVTTKNLDIALRMVGIQLDINIIDKVIDLVELIENKGDDVTIKDIVSLQQTWSRHSQAFH